MQPAQHAAARKQSDGEPDFIRESSHQVSIGRSFSSHHQCSSAGKLCELVYDDGAACDGSEMIAARIQTSKRASMAASRVLWAIASALLLVLALAAGPAAAQDSIAPGNTPEVVGDVSSTDLKLDVERFGVGGVVRPGSWIGVRVVVQDAATKPRELVIRLSHPDLDGDEPLNQREIATNPGVRQGVWLYLRLPARFKPGDKLTLAAFEGIESTAVGGGRALQGGRLLARAKVSTRNAVSSVVGLAAVVGNKSFGLLRFGTRLDNTDAAPFGQELTRVESGLSPAELPDRWQGLAPFDFLVWGGGDPGELRAERATAVREWVRRGGHLVIVLPPVGETWTNSKATELSSMLPIVSVRRREGVDLTAFRALFTERANTVMPKDGVVHDFTPAPDAAPGEAMRILNGPDGLCVVARRLHGVGAVTLIGLDLNHRAFAEAERLDPGVFWNRVLGRRGIAPTQTDIDKRQAANGEGFPNRTAIKFDGDIAGQIAKSGKASTGVLLGFVLFAVYWLVAGPGGFAVLKKRGMVRHAWLGYVVAAGVFTVIAWGGANLIREKRVQGTHLTIIDHVFGQPIERARVWMSLLVPKYGTATFRVGDAGVPSTSGDSADLAAAWEPPPEQGGAGGTFPDARGYVVDTRSPSSMTFPTRSTVKQLQIDWAGGPPWKMPLPLAEPDAAGEVPSGVGTIRLRPNRNADQSWLIGSLSHDLPGELRDVLVIVVPPQRDLGRGVLSTQIVSDARAFAVDRWAPGSASVLDLRSVTVQKPGSDTTLASYLRSQLNKYNGALFQTEGIKVDLNSAADRLVASSFLSQFEGITPATVRTDTVPWATRQNTHGLDLGRWLTQPCLIIIGSLGSEKEGAACPVPMTLDGEKFATTGRTIVRWVYPLPDEPPAFVASENMDPPAASDEKHADVNVKPIPETKLNKK